MTDQQKQEERIKAYAELMGETYVDPFPESSGGGGNEGEGQEGKDKLPKPASELSNEELINMLNERAGIKLSSLDDLKPQPTEDEVREAKEKREAAKLAYGLSTGKFTKDTYDAFKVAEANKLDLIKSDITTKIQTAYPELTAEQVAEKVALYTGANFEDDILRQERESELLELANSKLKNKFQNIINLDNDFEQHEQGITNKANFENKVKAALPVYQQDVKTVLASLSNFEVPVNDTKNPENNLSVKLTLSDTDIKELEDAFLEPDNIIRQIKEGYTPETLRKAAQLIIKDKHFDRFVSQAAKDYNSIQKEKYLQARKGLKSEYNLDIADDNLDKELTQQYQELIDSADKIK